MNNFQPNWTPSKNVNKSKGTFRLLYTSEGGASNSVQKSLKLLWDSSLLMVVAHPVYAGQLGAVALGLAIKDGGWVSIEKRFSFGAAEGSRQQQAKLHSVPFGFVEGRME